MTERYRRNSIHISSTDQRMIRHYKILIAGAGIGSVIAECLLRMGFENMTIVDGDTVELSNLNRQHYTMDDIGCNKATALRQWLLSINPEAHIKAISEFITPDNAAALVPGHQVAVNALDFDKGTPFIFDQLCFSNNMKVIHPYNLGWGGFVWVFSGETATIEGLETAGRGFELQIGRLIVNQFKSDGIPHEWLEHFLDVYGSGNAQAPPPQLAVGVDLLAGMVSSVIFSLATGIPVKYFPEYYYCSVVPGSVHNFT